MQDAPELRSIVEAAERAAADGDFIAAERHLRLAASLQESQPGGPLPDLANTLNNLGIVCERLGKVADAEACYRRAYAIAAAAPAPDDPVALTSRQNLKEFCIAQGRPFEPPTAPPPTPVPVVRASVRVSEPVVTRPEPPTVSAPPGRMPAAIALVVAGRGVASRAL
jgi:tetratricopeptide (TPR) repeat protein